MSDEHHNRAFFEQMATCRDAYRRLAEATHHVISPLLRERRVLDVGAGLGFVPARLAELGWEASASDPYAPGDLKDRGCSWWWNLPPLDIVWFGVASFDVVICTETAEHIDASAADTIVANVAGASRRLIVWSAAQPGQEWPGHVNLQPPAYWLEKFRLHGFEPFERATRALRFDMRLWQAQHHYATDNFYILQRRP